jgi:hypothetical protein
MFCLHRTIDNAKWVIELVNPVPVSEITFFLLPNAPIPPGYGAALYYSVPPFQNWEVLGCVFPDKPSGIFRTGWSTKEDMIGCPVVQLGVSIES